MADDGGGGLKNIARLSTGDKSRTARHASVMNELIDRVNALSNVRVTTQKTTTPDEKPSGKQIVSDANSVLTLKLPQGGELPPTDSLNSAKKYALVAIHAAVTSESVDLGNGWAGQWIEVCS